MAQEALHTAGVQRSSCSAAPVPTPLTGAWTSSSCPPAQNRQMHTGAGPGWARGPRLASPWDAAHSRAHEALLTDQRWDGDGADWAR